MKDKKKKPEEKKELLSDKKLDPEDLGKVSGGIGEGIMNVVFTETFDISESIINKI